MASRTGNLGSKCAKTSGLAKAFFAASKAFWQCSDHGVVSQQHVQRVQHRAQILDEPCMVVDQA